MEQNELTKTEEAPVKLIQALMVGNLALLTPEEKVDYYTRVCTSVGLNPLTKPFQYTFLQGKEVLYAGKECCEQLRAIHNISIQIMSREMQGDVYVITVRAVRVDGRYDESTSALCIGNMKGQDKANAYMKNETKAKRRVTLSICGLGMLDELEIADIDARHKKPLEIVASFSLENNIDPVDPIDLVKKMDDCASLDELVKAWSLINPILKTLSEKEKESLVFHKENRKKFLNEEANKNKAS